MSVNRNPKVISVKRFNEKLNQLSDQDIQKVNTFIDSKKNTTSFVGKNYQTLVDQKPIHKTSRKPIVMSLEKYNRIRNHANAYHQIPRGNNIIRPLSYNYQQINRNPYYQNRMSMPSYVGMLPHIWRYYGGKKLKKKSKNKKDKKSNAKKSETKNKKVKKSKNKNTDK